MFKRKSRGMGWEIIRSIIIFAVILAVFMVAVSRLSTESSSGQTEYIKSAVDRALVQCYVTEGAYPSSFEYLENNYGITYDKSHYRIDYRVYGSNMKPDVDIIELEGDK